MSGSHAGHMKLKVCLANHSLKVKVNDSEDLEMNIQEMKVDSNRYCNSSTTSHISCCLIVFSMKKECVR